MNDWLYTLRERLTSESKDFDQVRSYCGFTHVTELVTLDVSRCPSLVRHLRGEDWDNNVHQDYRTDFFRDADYLLSRQPTVSSKHHLVAALERPTRSCKTPPDFMYCGHELIDSVGNSILTDCGPIPEAFGPSDVNSYGLIDDCEKAYAIRDKLLTLQSDLPDLSACEVWLLARKIPSSR